MGVTVLTSMGNIKGRRAKNKANFQYYAFYKIPFAKPPVENLRFALPKPADPWTGMWKLNRY